MDSRRNGGKSYLLEATSKQPLDTVLNGEVQKSWPQQVLSQRFEDFLRLGMR